MISFKNNNNDTSLIVNDNWVDVKNHKENLFKKINNESSILTSCYSMRLRIALVSKNNYFLTGVRYLIESFANLSLHIYKEPNDFFNSAEKVFDAVIFDVSSSSDFNVLYRLALKVNFDERNTIVINAMRKGMKLKADKIFENFCNVKNLDSSISIEYLKKKIAHILKNITSETKGSHKNIISSTLTPRQIDILKLSAGGFSPTVIASKTGVSVSSIYTTKARALKKIGANDKSLEAILYSQLKYNRSYCHS